MLTPKHEIVRLQCPFTGDRVKVDTRIVPLIQVLWDADIKTNYCCQGYLDGEPSPKECDTFEGRMAYIAMGKSEMIKLLDLLDIDPELLEDLEPKHYTVIDIWELHFLGFSDNSHRSLGVYFPAKYISQITQEAERQLKTWGAFV